MKENATIIRIHWYINIDYYRKKTYIELSR